MSGGESQRIRLATQIGSKLVNVLYILDEPSIGLHQRDNRKLINSLKYALKATNIGDTKTLVIHPASTIYLHSNDEQRINAGVFDDTIRISIGIEDAVDLIEDFTNAINNLD